MIGSAASRDGDDRSGNGLAGAVENDGGGQLAERTPGRVPILGDAPRGMVEIAPPVQSAAPLRGNGQVAVFAVKVGAHRAPGGDGRFLPEAQGPVSSRNCRVSKPLSPVQRSKGHQSRMPATTTTTISSTRGEARVGANPTSNEQSPDDRPGLGAGACPRPCPGNRARRQPPLRV